MHLRFPCPLPPQAWEHIAGREGQALETLARIEAETAAERKQKKQQVGGRDVGQGVGGGE